MVDVVLTSLQQISWSQLIITFAFYKDSPSPSGTDEVQFNMDLNNNAGTRKRYGNIETNSSGIVAGNEYSSVIL